MYKEDLVQLVRAFLPFEPNSDQKQAIEKIAEFILTPEKSVFILTGYAGTGKTSLIGALVSALRKFEYNSVLMAPTGRAAKVLSRYARRTAFTIHRRIYKPKSANNLYGGFVLAPNKLSKAVFIVDEASMISNQKSEGANFGSGYLLNDLLTYVYSGKDCKLIVIGDTAQLPPVGLSVSPALERAFYESEGYTVFTANLSQVVRQANESGILYNATLLRNYIKNGETYKPPKLNVENFADIKRIGGAELTDALNESYEQVGIDQTLVITRSNKMANRYNAGIRSQILFKEERLSIDDLLMIVKNNYFWTNDKLKFIANGDIARISAIYSYKELYGKEFAKVTLDFDDYKVSLDTLIMLDILELEAPAMPYEEHKEFFNTVMEDYQDIENPRKRFVMVKKNEFFNALQVKFAYAVTCHKAQGGQWHTVFIDQTYFNNSMIDTDYFRWLYTAVTRATSRVYLVNFADDFFA